MMNVHDQIIATLQALNIPYERLEHPAVESCEDSARHRNAAGWTGVGSKCILFHAKGQYYLVVTTADQEIKARLFKKPFGTKDIRFAYAEELATHTGCRAGAVSPFGHPGTALPYFVDERILQAAHFMFNPAVPTESLRIASADLRRVYEQSGHPVTWFTPTAEGPLVFRTADNVDCG